MESFFVIILCIILCAINCDFFFVFLSRSEEKLSSHGATGQSKAGRIVEQKRLSTSFADPFE